MRDPGCGPEAWTVLDGKLSFTLLRETIHGKSGENPEPGPAYAGGRSGCTQSACDLLTVLRSLGGNFSKNDVI